MRISVRHDANPDNPARVFYVYDGERELGYFQTFRDSEHGRTFGGSSAMGGAALYHTLGGFLNFLRREAGLAPLARSVVRCRTHETLGAFSEVMSHMRLAGKPVRLRMRDSGYMVDIIGTNGKPCAGAVTYGEAGFYHDTARGFYYYPQA